MGHTEPVSLVLAVIVAAVGAGLLCFLVAKMFVELRRKRALLSQRESRGELDGDIERYLDRVWILYRAWRDRADEPAARRLDDEWAELKRAARRLQRERDEGEETADLVARLVESEDQFERLISEVVG